MHHGNREEQLHLADSQLTLINHSLGLSVVFTESVGQHLILADNGPNDNIDNHNTLYSDLLVACWWAVSKRLPTSCIRISLVTHN